MPRYVVASKSGAYVKALHDMVGHGAGASGIAYKAPENTNFPNSVNPEFRNSMTSLGVKT